MVLNFRVLMNNLDFLDPNTKYSNSVILWWNLRIYIFKLSHVILYRWSKVLHFKKE